MLKNILRIIGGTWRGRKLKFPASPALRPTPDRVRETLFNWLTPTILGARCLDLFAGSGALSFEALSRGAAQVTLIDNDPEIIAYLREQIKIFNTPHAHVYQAHVPSTQLSALLHPPFDIVFLDPPFNQNLIPLTCEWLIQNNLLAPHALIYLETEVTLTPLQLPLPSHWQLLRSKKTKQVGYHLMQS